jgi:2-oxoglutarate dehydrogenase E1 component
LIDSCVELGADSIVMGMPHRGRLNVLSNVVRKPHDSIFSEFSGTQDNFVEGSGDVKYHLGMVFMLSFRIMLALRHPVELFTYL